MGKLSLRKENHDFTVSEVSSLADAVKAALVYNKERSLFYKGFDCFETEDGTIIRFSSTFIKKDHCLENGDFFYTEK